MTPTQRAEKLMEEMKQAGERFPAERSAWVRIANAIESAEKAATERAAEAIENLLGEHANELSADAVDFANEMIDLIRNQEPT